MIDIDERPRRNRTQHLMLIGPGGAGKSSLARELAPLLGLSLVDLDEEFTRNVGPIDAFIATKGYAPYKMRNAMLAADIVGSTITPTLLVASSGFLTPDNPPSALTSNHGLVARWYSVCLLPSRDLERAVGIIVARQARRSFARSPECEEATIRARYPVYAALGDVVLFSDEPPGVTARALVRHRNSERAEGLASLAATP